MLWAITWNKNGIDEAQKTVALTRLLIYKVPEHFSSRLQSQLGSHLFPTCLHVPIDRLTLCSYVRASALEILCRQ